jgi:carboxypeptidase C (cathepsin A)
MRSLFVGISALILVQTVLSLDLVQAQAKEETAENKHETAKPEGFRPEQQASKGSVTIGGKTIPYDAFAGHGRRATQGLGRCASKCGERRKNAPTEASMFYVAYFKSGDPAAQRPVTFLFNGGPRSSTVWLHMGAFGPRRVVTSDNSHTRAAPYPIVNNENSLLDASDLVSVDAPGTGFSRIAGKDREKSFYGVDADAEAFADFISQFLAIYGRWNSPKYLFGESYGTTRSAASINPLETERNIDFNGVILLSQALCYDNGADWPQLNPGIDLPYQLALPTYTATAWYHHKLPDAPSELAPLLATVALGEGSALAPEQRQAIVAKLRRYTGLPADYIDKSDLRINAGQFEKTLKGDSDRTTGRLDTRFSGPTLDPLSKEAEYNPQSAATSSAYVSAFNDYIRKELKFGENREYKAEIDSWKSGFEPPTSWSRTTRIKI